ncbi:Fungal hydrophobin domain containing protein [Tylopilus felleus]
MFARFITLLPLALLASASSHLKARNQCSSGSISCCNSVQTLDEANSLLSAIGLASVAATVGGLVGLNCDAITVIGTGNTCTEQTVCCDHDNFNGLVNLGCNPINVNV